jgi:LacI family transcriptional regulator
LSRQRQLNRISKFILVCQNLWYACQVKRIQTAKDIAARVGVSQAAVSYAFSSRPEKQALISAETRERIFKVAKEVGYFPNALAQGIRTGKTGLIALWVPNFSNSVYLRTMRGTQEVATQHGMDVLVYGGSGSSGMENVLRSMGQRRVDGAIMIARPLEANANQVLGQLELPIVTVGGSITYPNVDSVLTRNGDAFKQMVLHLAAQGYTRIGHISGNLETATAQERYQGYRQGLRAAKLPFRQAWMRQGTYKAGSAGALALELIRQKNPPDALVVANDLMAIEALLALHDAGYTIPKDMAITGCDDIPEAEVVRPRLTSIRRPGLRAAHSAMTLLLERIGGYNGKARTVWLDAEVIPRESSIR